MLMHALQKLEHCTLLEAGLPWTHSAELIHLDCQVGDQRIDADWRCKLGLKCGITCMQLGPVCCRADHKVLWQAFCHVSALDVVSQPLSELLHCLHLISALLGGVGQSFLLQHVSLLPSCQVCLHVYY